MLPILFEDDDIIALDKPAGVCSIPERGGKKDDLLSLLTAERGARPFVVHRLDRDVSGVILFAKNAVAHEKLNTQFSGRSVKKTYTAVVNGVIAADKGTIDKPIRKFGSGRSAVDEAQGKASTTHYTVEKQFPQLTLVRVNPITGRRHQIRVHFYSIQHPVAGDLMYGDRALQRKFPRLLLHASTIEFTLPNGEAKRLQSPLPEAFQAFLTQAQQWRAS